MLNKEIYIKYFVIFSVYFAFGYLLWPFKSALLLAALFAFALTPVVDKILVKWPREKWIILYLVSGLFLIFIIPTNLVIGSALYNLAQINQDQFNQLPIYTNAEKTINGLWVYANEMAQNFDINLSEQIDIKIILPKIFQFVVPSLTALVTNLPSFLLQLIVFIVSLYYFLLKRKRIFYSIRGSQLLPAEAHYQLVQLIKRVCYTVVIASLVVASAQALIITLAAAIADFNHLIMILTISFILAFVPVIGSIPLSAALILFCFVQGETGYAVVILFAAIIAGTIDNVIRAYFLSSDEESVHPLISILTLIGALAVFGVSGLFLGPIIAELAFSIGKIMSAKTQDV